MYCPVRGRAGIFIDPSRTRVERRCILAHELVHHERSGGNWAPYMPASWVPVVAREEQLVNRIAAARLVPAKELRQYCERRRQSDLPTTALDVAEHFDVTEDVAATALSRLLLCL